MKAFQLLQRRRTNQGGPSVSLFPFLAVLICTMGALVPLLLAITRIARHQAEAAAVAKLSEQQGEIKTAREDVQWRVEQLQKSRDLATSQVSDRRLQLGHLEDHSRRLRQKIAQYERTIADLEQLESTDGQKRTGMQAELAQVQQQIEIAKQDVEQARQSASKRNKCYAIIPYEGPNQTHRRPIYLECRMDAVILQPEGIEFVESDFEGPLGAGNPLAMALRAAREYLLSRRDFDPEAGEPYPMLLVRTEGIGAYYAARAAMKSWGFDFGYELVDDNWKLAYPPADPQLANIVQDVIVSARASQARLIAAAPREYNTRPKATYRASPHGGFVREEGGDDDRSGYASSPSAGHVGRNAGSNARGTAMGSGSAGAGYGNNPGTGGYGTNPGTGGYGTNSGSSGYGTNPGTGGYGTNSGSGGYGTNSGTGGYENNSGSGSNGYGTGEATGGAPGGYAVGSGGYDTGSGPSLGSNATGMSSANTAGGGLGSELAGGPALTGTGSANAASNADATGLSSGGTGNGYAASAPGTGNPVRNGVAASNNPYRSTELSGASAGVENSQSAGSYTGNSSGTYASANKGSSNEKVKRPDGYVVGQPDREHPELSKLSKQEEQNKTNDEPLVRQESRILRPGEWEPTPEPPPKREKPKEPPEKRPVEKRERSLAEKRGEDWGLRDVARNSTGISRPIRIDCYADRLVVVSEKNPAASRVIPLGPRTSSSIDLFISSVWENMDTWGIAGRGMFWRPILNVYVAQDAEQRFADLNALLEGSGLTVVRK